MSDTTTSGPNRRANYGHTKRTDLLCHHLTVYGLTCDEYDAMRDRAQDACEICRTPDHETPRRELVIDHFQGGGLFFVRGLLCDRCNSVMSRHDRTAPWGPATRPWKEQARAYHLNAFVRPTAEEFRQADEYIQSHGAFRPRCLPLPQPKPSQRVPKGKPFVRLDHGPKQIARKLRSYLTPKQLARLIELLTEEETPMPPP